MARGFVRIFLQNSINFGPNLVPAPDFEANEGEELDVSADKGVNKTTGETFAVVPLPKPARRSSTPDALIAYTRKRVMEAAGTA